MLAGLVTFLVIGVIGVIVLKYRGMIPGSNVNPSASPVPNYEVIEPTATPYASAKPSVTPAPTYKPTTKGGEVKGSTTTTTTTTTTTKTVEHTKLTLMDSNKCPSTTTTVVREISGTWTVRYNLTDKYAANITIWKENGEELVKQTRVEDSGELAKIKDVNYFKIQIQAAECLKNDEHWITVTAEN